jgi:hypothetical protein
MKGFVVPSLYVAVGVNIVLFIGAAFLGRSDLAVLSGLSTLLCVAGVFLREDT